MYWHVSTQYTNSITQDTDAVDQVHTCNMNNTVIWTSVHTSSIHEDNSGY